MPLKIFANTYYEFFNNIFPGVGALSSFWLLDHSPYHGVFVGFRLMFDTNPPGSPGVGPKGKPMTDALGGTLHQLADISRFGHSTLPLMISKIIWL